MDKDIQFTFNDAHLSLTLPSRLDHHITSRLWSQIIPIIKLQKPQHVTLRANAVSYCDGTGISFLQTIEALQKLGQRHCEIIQLDPKFKPMLDAFSTPIEIIDPKPHKPFLVRFGMNIANSIAEFKETLCFIGEVVAQIGQVMRKPSLLRIKDMWRIASKAGPDALFIVALLGFLLGLIVSFQSIAPLQKFGADIYIVRIVTIGLVRELAALMTAIILTARTASAFAAELGTMKVNQEIDALTTMGLTPVRFLVLPRLFAMFIIMPLLTVYFGLFGLVGCLAMVKSLGFTTTVFIQQMLNAVTVDEVLAGILKSFVFAIIVASIGCLSGLKTHTGAVAVGQSTTRAVVNCIVTLAIVDGIFAVLYYLLGI